MKTFKFFGKLKDFNVHVQNVPMFRVHTFNDVYQTDIDKWTKLIEPYIFLPNTEENRNQMMEVLSPCFFKIESIYTEPA